MENKENIQSYTPKVSVIIATFNRAESLRSCLESLIRQTYKNFEVIIVDGGSIDNTKEVINLFSKELDIALITERRLWLSLVRDLGWRNARGEIISWIDDDVVVTDNWIEEVIKVFNISHDIGGVSGPTIIPKDRLDYRDIFILHNDKKGILWKIIAKIYRDFFLEGKPYAIGQIFRCGAWSPGSNFVSCLNLDGLTNVDYLEACNMSFRKSLVERVDGFDQNFRSVSEWCEVDLSFKIRKLGYRLVFNPKAVIHHIVSQTGIYKKRTFAYDRMLNFIYFYLKDIRLDSLNKAIRFSLYLLFLNVYWLYKFIKTKNINWLTGLLGTLSGLIKYI